MYLKNISKETRVIVRTRMGKFSMDPGEVVEVKERLYSPISSNLREATEEEYKSFLKGEKQIEESNETMDDTVSGETNTKDIDETIKASDNKIQAINAVKDELTGVDEITPETIANTIDKVSKDIKDNDTLDFIKNLFQANMMASKEVVVEKEEVKSKKKQEKVEEKEALKVQTTTENTQRQILEEQIANLKETWKKAKMPKKKEKIAKQIKELQKQLDKI